ncbi:MAG: hypothetical protein MRERV_57c007 [Mycoplasmataceae bacterium RV_VA103A]|nr:MAG: hypothetical protein MRERV_57c007 [Mycoplasmataceae bacterium RV_VA103A]
MTKKCMTKKCMTKKCMTKKCMTKKYNQSEFECDKCQQPFIRRWSAKDEEWSKINEVKYWTGGKKWNDYQIICTDCLSEWFTNYRRDFSTLVDKEKKQLFYYYRYVGLLSKQGENSVIN